MLDSATGWSARILQVGQNMTINLKSEQLILGVVTQGRKDCLEWVASFKAQTSFDGRNYTDVDGGQEFMANIGPNAKVEVCFGEAVPAKYLRLLPQTWSTHMSMRAAVLVQDRQGNPAHIASRSDHCTNSRLEQSVGTTVPVAAQESSSTEAFVPKEEKEMRATLLIICAIECRNMHGPARGPWTNLGRLPLRVFSIGKYAFQKKRTMLSTYCTLHILRWACMQSSRV